MYREGEKYFLKCGKFRIKSLQVFNFQVICFIQISTLSKPCLITYIKNPVFYKCDSNYKQIRRIEWNSEVWEGEYKLAISTQAEQESKLQLVLWDVLGYDWMHEENVLCRDNEKRVSWGILSIIAFYVPELQDKGKGTDYV